MKVPSLLISAWLSAFVAIVGGVSQAGDVCSARTVSLLQTQQSTVKRVVDVDASHPEDVRQPAQLGSTLVESVPFKDAGSSMLQSRVAVVHEKTAMFDEQPASPTSREKVDEPDTVKAPTDKTKISTSKKQRKTDMWKGETDQVGKVGAVVAQPTGKHSFREEMLLQWQHLQHLADTIPSVDDLRHALNQPSLLSRGLYEQGFARNQRELLPTRTGPQLCRVFIVVFSVVALSWVIFFVRSKFGAAETLHRVRLVALCLSLSACSWGMTVANKHLMMTLAAPGFVTALQMIIAVVISIVLSGGQSSFKSEQVFRWLVVPMVACLQLWTSLYTMKYLTLSMLMLIRNLGPILTLPCEMLMMPRSKRPAVTCASVFALLLVLSSAATYFGGIPPSGKGCAFAFLNLSLAVIDVVLRRRLLTMECCEMPTTMCMLLNNLVGILPSLLLGFCTEELLHVDPKSAFSKYNVGILIISGMIGSGISYFALNVQREIAATSFMVLENGIRLGEVVAGVMLFKDPFTWPAQVIGLCVSYCGSIWYAKVQFDSSEHANSKLDGS